jgi:hypothetical protein
MRASNIVKVPAWSSSIDLISEKITLVRLAVRKINNRYPLYAEHRGAASYARQASLVDLYEH